MMRHIPTYPESENMDVPYFTYNQTGKMLFEGMTIFHNGKDSLELAEILKPYANNKA